MSKTGLFLKVLFLAAALAAVAAVITVVRSRGGESVAAGSGRFTFFDQFVLAGGPIVWFVLLPLSTAMVYLTADYAFKLRRGRLLPVRITQRLAKVIADSGVQALASEVGEQEDLVSTAVAKALNQGRDWLSIRSAVTESLAEQAGILLRKIEWISLIGNVSPMVGLFGTVFGMIKLFNAIVLAGGQPQPAQLAEGISVALVTTFWGLFIAIPAVAVYGVFQNRIETLVAEAVDETEAVLVHIRAALRKNAEQRYGRTQRIPIEELSRKRGRKPGQVSVEPCD